MAALTLKDGIISGPARSGLRCPGEAVPREGARLRVLRRLRLGQGGLLRGQRALVRRRPPLRQRGANSIEFVSESGLNNGPKTEPMPFKKETCTWCGVWSRTIFVYITFRNRTRPAALYKFWEGPQLHNLM